jgi:hypothetical protein
VTDDSGALLVVDDEQFLREAVAAFLSSPGFTVTSAETGIQALRTARARHFDLLILDVMLPYLMLDPPGCSLTPSFSPTCGITSSLGPSPGPKIIHTQHAIGYCLQFLRPEDDDET